MSDWNALNYRDILYVFAAPLGLELGVEEPALVVNELAEGAFDEGLEPALVGVWYAMYPPKNRFKTLNLPLSHVHAGAGGFPCSHNIPLIPGALLTYSK